MKTGMFREYLKKCEIQKKSPQVTRQEEDFWCEVVELKNQYAANGKDISKVKVHDARTGRSFWVSFKRMEKEWRWT